MKYLYSLLALMISFTAAAQDTATVGGATAASGQAQSPGMEGLIFEAIFVFAIFYFLIIRPQQKKLKSHTVMVSALKKGDKVLIGAGVHGVVSKANDGDDFIFVEIAPDTEVKVQRSAVSGLAEQKPAVAKPAVTETTKK